MSSCCYGLFGCTQIFRLIVFHLVSAPRSTVAVSVTCNSQAGGIVLADEEGIQTTTSDQRGRNPPQAKVLSMLTRFAMAWTAPPPPEPAVERCRTDACREVYARLQARAQEAPSPRWSGLLAPDWKEKRRARMARARAEEQRFAQQKQEFERDERAYAQAAEAKLEAMRSAQERGEDEEVVRALGEAASRARLQAYEEEKRVEAEEIRAYERRLEEKRAQARARASDRSSASPSDEPDDVLTDVPCPSDRTCT